MIERPWSRHLGAGLAACLLVLVAGLRLAHADAPVPIGYVEITDDPRYDDKWAYASLLLAPGGRPVAGAELALDDININGQAFNLQFALQKAEAPDAKGMIAAIQKLVQDANVHLFLIDASDAILAEVSKVRRYASWRWCKGAAESDALRAGSCQPNLLHTIPS